MPHSKSSLVRLLLAIALGVAACSGDDVTAPPTSGSLEVTASTTGAEPDADGYILQMDAEAPQTIEATGTVPMADIAPGDHTMMPTVRPLTRGLVKPICRDLDISRARRHGTERFTSSVAGTVPA